MYQIYHNPRCRKSRETLQILNDNGISEEVGNLAIVLYLENPLSKETLTEVAKFLGMSPIEFTRTKEDRFKELRIDKKTVLDKEIFNYMAENPIIIERPIVIKKDAKGEGVAAVIGRPPENVLDLIK